RARGLFPRPPGVPVFGGVVGGRHRFRRWLRPPPDRPAGERRPDRRTLPRHRLRRAPASHHRAPRRCRLPGRGAGLRPELRLPLPPSPLRDRVRGALPVAGGAAAPRPRLPDRPSARQRPALAGARESGSSLLSGRLRRWLRRAAIVVAALLVLLVVGLWVASQTDVVQEMVRARVLDVLREHLDAEVALGRVDGTLGHSLHLLDLRITLDGRTVVRVPRI